jgi:gamma-glutamyl phosphate reductase
MTSLIRTDSDNKDFIQLVKALDADLAHRDGNEHSFYDQFNKIDTIRHVVVAYENDKPVSCGAMKEVNPATMEIKRLATKILTQLETWATELSYEKCLLETGKRQPEAIELYRKNGYIIIPNYGQYAGVENSLCFEKTVK